jgi:hypothetical protein
MGSNEPIKNWLARWPSVRGLLACGVRFTDGTSVNQSYSCDCPLVALEHAWRCVGDTFDVLAAYQQPATRLRWRYELAHLHCARRKDGTLLGLFVTARSADLDAAAIERLMAEFEALPDGAG